MTLGCQNELNEAALFESATKPASRCHTEHGDPFDLLVAPCVWGMSSLEVDCQPLVTAAPYMNSCRIALNRVPWLYRATVSG